MNRVLVTKGQGFFEEQEFPSHMVPKPDEIYVKSIMTGVCRSDIDMMCGTFGPLPVDMQGHEGLGQVISVGTGVQDVKAGDFVATRGEPAYADYYIAKQFEYVQVPEADPKYIIEPVACALNLIEQNELSIIDKQRTGADLLILGSGFLAYVVYHYLKLLKLKYNITVVGSSNSDLWGAVLQKDYTGTFDVVVDLSNRTDIFDKDILNNQALVIFGSQKTVTTDFAKLLWKSATVTFPSPRSAVFHKCMKNAVTLIQNGHLNVDKFWTRAYNREHEWRQAFQDGLNRPANYSRGYIKWD